MVSSDNLIEKENYLIENFERALSNEWFDVYYQPIVRTVNSRVCSEEALVRWDDPILGILNPAEFLPVLEKMNVCYKLDFYVLNHILNKMKRQLELGLYVVPTSINVSKVDFYSCDIVNGIRERVAASGIDSNKIVIEVAESTIAQDNDYVIEKLRQFQSLGFGVCMDDYGAGDVSPILLQKFRFDFLKLNMRLVNQIKKDDNARIIINELVRMAMSLGVETAAEGVEDKEQVDFLNEIGCIKLQGYYYCKPVPMETVFKRYENGTQIGFENPEEKEYYSQVGKVNMYDFSFLKAEGDEFEGYFDTLPFAILETDENSISVMRANKNFRLVLERNFPGKGNQQYFFSGNANKPGYYTMNSVRQCGKDGVKRIIDDRTKDGRTVQVLINRLVVNKVTGKAAVALVILSVSENKWSGDSMTYNYIARALSEDYIKLFFVDLDNNSYVEYNPDGLNRDVSIERSGENFFEMLMTEEIKSIYKDDKVIFSETYTKKAILKRIEKNNNFSLVLRKIIDGEPRFVSVKVVKLKGINNQIIVGICDADEQIKQRKAFERLKEERSFYSRIMTLSGNYLAIYTIDSKTGHYTGFKSFQENESFGIKKQGKDFFSDSTVIAKKVLSDDDFCEFERIFTKENILKFIKLNGFFRREFRIVNNQVPKYICLKAKVVVEEDIELIIMGVIDIDSQVKKEKEYANRLSAARTKASTDELTGVKNKHAYADMESSLNELLKVGKCTDLAVVVCDLNGLKQINDSYGHKVGDAFIKQGCKIICDAFSHSPVFRIGGDEFAIIVQGKDYTNLDAIIESIGEINRINKEKGIVTIAVGFARKENGDIVADIFERADALMYANKKKMKEELNN